MWKKILLIEDDIAARSKLYEIFYSQGHNITCVPTAKAAFIILTEQRFDIIILDDLLPDGTGVETAKKIREFDTEVKIILLCEGAGLQNKNIIKKLRLEAVIKKDFSSHIMIKTILEILRQGDSAGLARGPAVFKGNVLVVDDNVEIQKTLESFLKKRGYKAQIASSGEDALMKIKMEKPVIVFLDFTMPGMDGIMALRQIKRLDDSINVVMLTSVQDEYIIEQAAREGACDYLVKPCDLHKLDLIITAVLSNLS